jgi:hypothetical protein
VKRHHTVPQEGSASSLFLFASLLERKQEEKICVHNILEGGV